MLDLDGDCESLLGKRGGMSIVVRDLSCPLVVVGGGNLGVVLSSSVGHVDCIDSDCCILQRHRSMCSSSTVRSFLCSPLFWIAQCETEGGVGPGPDFSSVVPGEIDGANYCTGPDLTNNETFLREKSLYALAFSGRLRS